MAVEIRFEVPGRGVMRGFATDTGPELEYAVIEHPAPGGGVMFETVVRAIVPPEPAPAPQPPEAAAE